MPNITSLQFFIPELVLSATAIVLLFCSFFQRTSYIAIFGLLLSFFFTLKQWNFGSPPLFWGMLILDKPVVFFKVIFIITALIVIIFSQRSRELLFDLPEFYALLVGSVLGMNLLASSNNLLMIYLSLEFVSLMSYLLVGYVRGSVRSSEAALKYVLYGAVASGIFLYGASLYYGLNGTLDVKSFLTIAPSHYRTNALAGLFLLAGFLYKIAAVPMHAWCPDAYEGAPTPITAFLSVAPKAAGFAVLMRVFASVGVQFNWPIIIAVISAVTMTFGNLAAIPQTNVKRLLAYSSIAHVGYLLMGVASATPKGNEAVYFYFAAYLIMNLGAFLVVQIVSDGMSLRAHEAGVAIPSNQLSSQDCFADARNDSVSEHIEAFTGLGRRGSYGTILGIAMTIFLLSLTGVPPFVGFIGKFYIFSAVIDAELYWLAIIGIINSVVSLYYYMRIVKTMFFDSPKETSPITLSSRRLTAALATLAVATIVLGLAWQWLAEIISRLVGW